MYRLENVLRPYAWGSTTAIADLLGTTPSGGPEAELWIGAHPDSPSLAELHDGSKQALDALIATDLTHFLGQESVSGFGPQLPFLTKVLAAAQPLSLQVHPTLGQAREGFAREDAAGLARDAANRNYRDDNHKPEMIFALTPFEALCGFRPVAESRGIFEYLAALFGRAGMELPDVLRGMVSDLSGDGEADALRAAFSRLICGGDDVSEATAQVLKVLGSGASAGPFVRELSTVVELDAFYSGDPGVLISLLLNRVTLAPGEAVYLPAGNVHAYLSGLGVEVMASSDNVLRGGLTPKYIDVPELTKTIEFAALGIPRIEAARSDLGQELYQPPFQEFQLQRIELAAGAAPVPLAQSGPAVVIVTGGSVVLDSPTRNLPLGRGESAFVPASENPVMVHAAGGADEPSVAFAVTTSMKA